MIDKLASPCPYQTAKHCWHLCTTNESVSRCKRQSHCLRAGVRQVVIPDPGTLATLGCSLLVTASPSVLVDRLV